MLAHAKPNGIPAGIVLADAGYGDSSAFRAGGRQLGLHFAVGIQLGAKVQLVRNEGEVGAVDALLFRVGARPFRRYAWGKRTKDARCSVCILPHSDFPCGPPRSGRVRSGHFAEALDEQCREATEYHCPNIDGDAW